MSIHDLPVAHIHWDVIREYELPLDGGTEVVVVLQCGLGHSPRKEMELRVVGTTPRVAVGAVVGSGFHDERCSWEAIRRWGLFRYGGSEEREGSCVKKNASYTVPAGPLELAQALTTTTGPKRF